MPLCRRWTARPVGRPITVIPWTRSGLHRTSFDLRVGPNHFSAHEIGLAIDTPERRLVGCLRFDGVVPWPVTWRAPGIMDWYALMPFMECYHGVLSFDHAIRGQLVVDDAAVDFSGGRGYIEKIGGRPFPVPGSGCSPTISAPRAPV